jgi:hypothetical protein
MHCGSQSPDGARYKCGVLDYRIRVFRDLSKASIKWSDDRNEQLALLSGYMPGVDSTVFPIPADSGQIQN